MGIRAVLWYGRACGGAQAGSTTGVWFSAAAGFLRCGAPRAGEASLRLYIRLYTWALLHEAHPGLADYTEKVEMA